MQQAYSVVTDGAEAHVSVLNGLCLLTASCRLPVETILTLMRCYSTGERMTGLFRKITNQMIAKSKQNLTQAGRLWE